MVNPSLNRYDRGSARDIKDGYSNRTEIRARNSGPRNERSPINDRSRRNGGRREDSTRNRRGNSFGNRESNDANGNAHSSISRRAQWRVHRARRRREEAIQTPLLSGGNTAPVSGPRRSQQMNKMRMDNYPPRRSRGNPNVSRGSDIDHAVVKARREASKRTKDTYWTKKLLEAETSHPNRWAHSGFKEMYRDELGLPEEQRGTERDGRRSQSRDRRPARDGRGPNEPKSSVARSRRPSGPRGGANGRNQTNSKSSLNRRWSPRRDPLGRRRSPRNSRSRSPISRSRGRRASRSYSISSTSSVSSVTSRSRSGSYSSTGSSFTTDSLSDSSVSSIRSYRRSGSSQSFSSSSSISVKRHSRNISSPTNRNKKSAAVKIGPKPNPKKKPIPIKAPPEPPKDKQPPIESTFSKSAPMKSSSRSAVMSSSFGSRRSRSPISNIPIITMDSPKHVDYYKKDHPGLSSQKAHSKTLLKPDVQCIHQPSANSLPGSTNQPISLSSRFTKHQQQPQPTLSDCEQSGSESSSDEEEGTLKVTLSERFGKLAQLSSQRQEYEGVRMKIVREGGQDKKVYMEGRALSRSVTPSAQAPSAAHDQWVKSHKAEYDEYEERYGQFRQWDPHRDLPRELPPNWDDVNVRYRYYKESGYFGDRSITMNDYLKWEDWWYRYRDWLEKYGDRADHHRPSYPPEDDYDYGRYAAPPRDRDRWAGRIGPRSKPDRKRYARY